METKEGGTEKTVRMKGKLYRDQDRQAKKSNRLPEGEDN